MDWHIGLDFNSIWERGAQRNKKIEGMEVLKWKWRERFKKRDVQSFNKRQRKLAARKSEIYLI